MRLVMGASGSVPAWFEGFGARKVKPKKGVEVIDIEDDIRPDPVLEEPTLEDDVRPDPVLEEPGIEEAKAFFGEFG